MPFSLDASDRVRLDTCVLDHDTLVDLLTDGRYPLSPTAAALLAGCDGQMPVGHLADEHARAYGVDPSRLLADLGPFVTELAEVGLVRVQRRWRHHVAGFLLDLGRTPPEAPVARRRFPATTFGCTRAALHGGRAAVLLGTAWSCVLALAVHTLAPGAPLTVALVPATVALAGVVSVAAHEIGHLLAVRAVRGHPRYAAAGPSQVGLLHDVRDVGRRRWVAVAGPVAGALVALALAPLAATLPAPADGLALPLTAVLAVGHLVGLLPFFKDGRHLWAPAA